MNCHLCLVAPVNPGPTANNLPVYDAPEPELVERPLLRGERDFLRYLYGDAPVDCVGSFYLVHLDRELPDDLRAARINGVMTELHPKTCLDHRALVKAGGAFIWMSATDEPLLLKTVTEMIDSKGIQAP